MPEMLVAKETLANLIRTEVLQTPSSPTAPPPKKSHLVHTLKVFCRFFLPKHRNIVQLRERKRREKRESRGEGGINRVVQRRLEHQCYGCSGGWVGGGLGVRGSLVQSGWRVMAVRCGFQCGAAGWHSDEDNDVLVSHRITECGGRAGLGGGGW